MAKYRRYDGDSMNGNSYVKGLILIFVGAVAMMFALVGIVFGTTIIFAAQSISETDIMSDYKYPYTCFATNGTELTKYGTETDCKSALSTNYWNQDTSGAETDAYSSWKSTNKTVAEGTKTLVKALSLALAFVGIIFFILGLKNTGLFNIGMSKM